MRRVKDSKRLLHSETTPSKTRVVRAVGLPREVPKQLPPGLEGYKMLYSTFLKHAFREGKLRGNLAEIGPGEGNFLDFLQTNPFFDRNPDFSIMGIDQRPDPSLPIAVEAITMPFSVENLVKSRPQVKETIDFVVARQVLNSPNAKEPAKIFHAISLLAKKGGKAFLETTKPEEMPSREQIRKEGFKVIDMKAVISKQDFHSLKKGQYIKFVLVLEKVK